ALAASTIRSTGEMDRLVGRDPLPRIELPDPFPNRVALLRDPGSRVAKLLFDSTARSLGDLERVFQDRADEVGDRHARAIGQALELSLQDRRDARVEDTLLPRGCLLG